MLNKKNTRKWPTLYISPLKHTTQQIHSRNNHNPKDESYNKINQTLSIS